MSFSFRMGPVGWIKQEQRLNQFPRSEEVRRVRLPEASVGWSSVKLIRIPQWSTRVIVSQACDRAQCEIDKSNFLNIARMRYHTSAISRLAVSLFFVWRPGRRNKSIRKIFLHREHVDFGIECRMLQEGVYFGCEDKSMCMLAVVKRLLAKTVPH